MRNTVRIVPIQNLVHTRVYEKKKIVVLDSELSDECVNLSVVF